MNYKRTSGAFTAEGEGCRIFVFGLRCLYLETSYVVLTKEGMLEGNYDRTLLKFPFKLELENFQGFTAIKNKFVELVRKRETSTIKNDQDFCH